MSKIFLKTLSFTNKALKRIKKENDKIREKEILEELKFLVLNGISANHQERLLNKYKNFDLIDYLEHHKKQRIILFKKSEEEYQIIDILFDHLGRDELDYKRYWDGEENIDFNERVVLKEKELEDIFIQENYNKFYQLI